MKLLVTINCHGVDASAQGGISLAAMMRDSGHDVTVQAAPRGPVSQAAKRRGLKVAGPDLRKSAFVKGVIPFRKLLRRIRPDVVCATRADGQTACALLAPKIPLVRVRCDIRKPSSGFFWKIIDSRTDLVVFPSPFMLERGFQGERKGPVRIVPHAVDTDRFSPVAELASEPLVLSLGRLSPMKGHRTLIRALALLPEEVGAVIAGPPSQQSADELQAFARELGVEDRLSLPGRVEDPVPLMHRASLGVVTSLGSEVVSRAGMEMMSAGLPLLAASTNGLLDLMDDGRTGLLHSPGNHRQLAAQILFLLRNPELSRRMGRRARKRCLKYYSPKVIGDVWQKTLKEMVADRIAEQIPVSGVSR